MKIKDICSIYVKDFGVIGGVSFIASEEHQMAKLVANSVGGEDEFTEKANVQYWEIPF